MFEATAISAIASDDVIDRPKRGADVIDRPRRKDALQESRNLYI